MRPTIDHGIPKSTGGPSTIANLLTACGPCNMLKADYWFEDLLYPHGVRFDGFAPLPSPVKGRCLFMKPFAGQEDVRVINIKVRCCRPGATFSPRLI
jgi:hypothetical protein